MGFFKPFALERFFAKHEFSARYLLCSSDCESIPIGDLLRMEESATERLLGLRLGYTETRGAPSLRTALAGEYQRLSPDDFFVHAGAEEAILNLCLATLKPGDRVIVNSPCYQSLRAIPEALGCDAVPWQFRETADGHGGTRWRIDPSELSGLCAKGARMIILNAPHNPTGALPTREEFDAIIAQARSVGAILLVDEVYRRLERDQTRRLPSVCELYENGVALDVLSKHAGLAGLRIGWLASKRGDILDAVAVVKDYNSICSSAPSELLAEIAIKHLDTLVARNREIINNNLALLDDFFKRRPDFARWTAPEGGSIAFPCLSGGADAESLAERLVKDCGVLLLPGSLYSYDRSYFRLGFGRANLPEALGRLEEWLDTRG